MAPERFNPLRRTEEKRSHSEAELDAQEKLDNAIFAFEDRLRAALDNIEFSGDERYSWEVFIRYGSKLLTQEAPENRHKPKFSRENIKLALAVRDALPPAAAERDMLISAFKKGTTRLFGDQALIALDTYLELGDSLTRNERFISAARTAAFHDWHDAIDFDNEKLPQPDGVFKFTRLVQTTVDRCVERGLEVPIGSDGKLNVEELMNKAYQEELIPEANYTKFETEMAPYFSSERAKKK